MAAPLSRTVTIAPAVVRNTFTALKEIDFLTHATAFILACFTAYAATNSPEAWGTSSDYVALIGGAFGVTAGTQGIRTIVGAVRGAG